MKWHKAPPCASGRNSDLEFLHSVNSEAGRTIAFRRLRLEIRQHRFFHGPCGAQEPVARALLEIGRQRARGDTAEVDVRRFPSHGIKEPYLVALLAHGGKVDARAIGSQAAH